MAVNYDIIGQRIRKSRRKRKLSQAKLAEYTELSVGYISLIETGKKQASLDSLVRIVNILGVTVDYLLAGNQASDVCSNEAEYIAIMDDCSSYEKQVIVDVASAIKGSLRRNKQH